MVNHTAGGRGRNGSPRQRSVAAAARAAARRSERAHRPPTGPDEPGATRKILTTSVSVETRSRAASAETRDRIPPPLQAIRKLREQIDRMPTSRSGTAAETDTQPQAPPRRPSRLVLVLVLLILAGSAATAVLGLQHRDADSSRQARADALAAARTAAPVILSYDYRHLARDFAAADSHLTGPFRDQYRKTTQTVVGPTAARYHGIVKATVAQPTGGLPAASVVSATPDSAVVLLFMNQVTTSTQISGPRLDLDRVRMTLTSTPGGWKVSAVDAL
ncbi:hypothetical protein NGB36_26595 [Streptomyces sp. RB6PN25]|uniref:Mce-associated membrane protein n=1 Tax=Streptomyces humicola TaxID=2953240 RepID=A0ABT1Q2F0_9ACTN|nr:hypothetical protein [Streptomyces humicola]MCQ4084054.1 hypothetical protein [Streptomyces humicola]